MLIFWILDLRLGLSNVSVVEPIFLVCFLYTILEIGFFLYGLRIRIKGA